MMERDEIIAGLVRYFEGYVAGHEGHLTDELYKHVVFALFRAAYRNGYTGRDSDHSLSPDRVVEEVRQHLGTELGERDEVIQLLEHLHAAWTEWSYAIDRYGDAD